MKQCINYKVAMMTFKVRLHQQLLYFSKYVVDYTPPCALWSSAKKLLAELRTKILIVSLAFS